MSTFEQWQDKGDHIFPEVSNGDQDNDIKRHRYKSHNENSVRMRTMAESSQSIVNPVAIAASVIDLYQLSRGMLPMFDQACDFTPDETIRGFRNDLVALSNTLKDIQDLFIIDNTTEEIQGHSRCLSVGIYEELQKLTRESRMVLESLSRLIYGKQDAIRRYPSLFGTVRRTIGAITLRWKTVLDVFRMTYSSSLKDLREFDNHSKTKDLRHIAGESQNRISSPSPSEGADLNSEKIKEYSNNTIAAVGTVYIFPDHRDGCAHLCDLLSEGHRSFDHQHNEHGSAAGTLWAYNLATSSTHEASGWCLGDRYGVIDDRGGAECLNVVASIACAKGNKNFGDQGQFGHATNVHQILSRDEGRSYINSSNASPEYWKGYRGKDPFRATKNATGYIFSTGIQPITLEPSDPKQIKWIPRHSRAPPALGLAVAMPVALVSGACAFCMYSYAANRHGWQTLHSAEKLFFVAAINDPSPPWLVAATLVHGIATLFYYYLRPSDRFREVFVGAGIVTASACGIWSGVDVEGLLLGVLPIVITASLFLCTITNVAAEGFKSVSCLQQSRELDLEKEAGK